MSQPKPSCDYCGDVAELLNGQELYGMKHLEKKFFWVCRPCDAWVGCHLGTHVPMGRLSNNELRLAKRAAHAAFDPLWKAKMKRDSVSKPDARYAGYKWLSEQLGIGVKECHIGMFDVHECQDVVRICNSIRKK